MGLLPTLRKGGRNPLTGEPWSEGYVEAERDRRANLPMLRASALRAVTQALDSCEILVLSADVGAGKTTQMPKVLMWYLGDGSRVVTTSPRAIPAVQLARQVATELDVRLGGPVGFQHRFEKKHSGDATRLLFATEGSLLRRGTDGFHGVIIDEAHERNVETDLLLLRVRDEALARRADGTRSPGGVPWKAVVMSATADTERFVEYFREAGVRSVHVHVPRRTFPIERVYADSVPRDYVRASVDAVLRLHRERPVRDRDNEDVLVFLATKAETERAASMLNREAQRAGLKIGGYRLSSDTPDDEARLHLSPAEAGGLASALGLERKAVFSTNVAETSLTVPTLTFVVDAGRAITQGFDAEAGVPVLRNGWVSQANVAQRVGRVGRVRPGVAYLLYTERHHDGLPRFAPPAMHTTDVSGFLLEMASERPEGGLPEVRREVLSRVIDPPPPKSLRAMEKRLTRIGAVDEKGRVTRWGGAVSKMTVLGVDMAHAALHARSLGCDDEVLALACLAGEFRRIDDAFVLQDGDKPPPLPSAVRSEGEALLLFFDRYLHHRREESVSKANDWAREGGMFVRKWDRAARAYADARKALRRAASEASLPARGAPPSPGRLWPRVVAAIREALPCNVATPRGRRFVIAGTRREVRPPSGRLYPRLDPGGEYVFLGLTLTDEGMATSISVH